MKTLVIGIGNPLLCDDGIGAIIVNDLKEKLDNKLFDFTTEYISSMELVNLIQGYHNLVIVDGKMTHEGTPGEVTLFSVEDYYGMTHLDNYHDVSFRDMISLGRSLNLDIPENIKISAVEIVEDKLFSKTLSPLLQNKYGDILEEVEVILEQMTQVVRS